MVTEVARLEAVFTADTKDFDKGVKDAQKGIGKFTSNLSSQLKSAGRDITNLGRNIMGFTAPLAAGFGVAIKSAMDFDNIMTNTASLMGRSRNEMVGLNDEILRIGGQSLEGVVATGNAFYDIVSGVQDATTHMEILNGAIMMSEAGQASLVTATSAMIDSMNSYGFGAEQASYVTDVFTRSVGMGKTTLDQLASAMPAVLGIAAEMGVPLHDVGVAMSYMTTQGATASEAGTRLKGVLMTMLNPTANLEKAIKAMGYESGQAMVESEGLQGALEKIKKYGGGSFAGLFTNQEALLGAIALTKDGFSDFSQSYMEGLDGITAATHKIQMDSPTAQFKLLTSGIEEMGIRIGTALLPALNDMLAGLMPVIGAVTDWIAQNPQAVQAVAGLAFGLMALGVVLVPLGMLIKVAGIAIGAVTVASGVLSGVLAFLAANPVVALVTGIGALLAVLGSGEGGLVGGFNRAVTAAQQLAQLGIYFVMNALNELSNSPLFTAIRTAFETAFNGIRGIVEGVVGSITGFLGGVRDTIENVLAGLGLIQRQSQGHGMTMGQIMGGVTRMQQEIAITTGAHVAPTPLPQRALGGNVWRGQTTLVGEDGPELITPNRNGMVWSNPNTRGGNNFGGGGTTIVINGMTVNGVQDVQRLLDELNKVAARRGA